MTVFYKHDGALENLNRQRRATFADRLLRETSKGAAHRNDLSCKNSSAVDMEIFDHFNELLPLNTRKL